MKIKYFVSLSGFLIYSLFFGICINAQTYTLEQYEAMALESSNSIQIARERIKVAENIEKVAFTQFLPNFNGVASYIWNQKKISMISQDALLPVGTKMSDGSFGFTPEQINNGWTVIDGQPVPLDADGVPFNPKTNPEKIEWKNYALLPKDALTYDMRNIFVGGIGFTQPIFMGFKIRELYKISKNSREIAQLSFQKEQEDLIVEVDKAYWLVVSLINKKQLAESYVELLTTLYNNVQKAIEEGVATKGDALNVKVKLNEANLALSKATNGITLAKMQLFYLAGLDMRGDYSLADSDFTKYSNKELEISNSDVVNEALTNRFELKELDKLEDISNSQIQLARSRFMPNIIATGNYYMTNPNTFNGFSKSFKGAFSLGIGITIPIFHFGDRIYTLRAAEGEHRIVMNRIEQARKLITLESTLAKQQLDEAKEKQVSASSNIEAAEENLRLATLSYKEGLISLSDLLTAQTAYISAKSEKIDADIDVRMSELMLRKSMGKSNLPTD